LRVFTAGARPLPLAGPSRAVLGYVFTHRDRAVPRAEVAAAVWADHDEEGARRCLSTALWRLKRCGGEALLRLVGSDALAAGAAPLWLDVLWFERRQAPLLHVAAERLSEAELMRLERAVRLVRGPYLAEVDAEWALVERQRLHALRNDALYHLTCACAARRQWSRALHWGRVLAHDEPLREDVQRVLMRAHADAGARARALDTYREFEQRLRRELGVEPMAETRELARDLGRTPVPLERMAFERKRAAFEPLADAGVADAARRRIGRVQRALEASARQLEAALKALPTP
jgi:DNA-binding SARP family transcriptional activator